MDTADMYEILATGSADATGRRVLAQMAANAELPKADDKETDEVLVRLGFVLGGQSPSRKNFRQAALPKGWAIKLSDHRMYSHVYDEKGRRRAQIGYEAQDGWASLSLFRRFTADSTRLDSNERESPELPCIMDSDKRELWRGFPVPAVNEKTDPKWYEKPSASQLASQIAAGKLSQIAPLWHSVEAYWGEDGDAIVWPPHDTPPDTRESYKLFTQCYSNGNYGDGGEQDACKAKTDAEAKKRLLGNTGGLSSYYDEVRWTIKCGDRVVDTGTIRRPPPQPRMRYFDEHGRFDPYGRDEYGYKRHDSDGP